MQYVKNPKRVFYLNKQIDAILDQKTNGLVSNLLFHYFTSMPSQEKLLFHTIFLHTIGNETIFSDYGHGWL